MKTISPNLQKLVQCLNDGELHSGDNLSKFLKISRNAIWKHINQLIKYGIRIEPVQSRGYRLAAPLILLDQERIKSELENQDIELILLGSTSSTNDYFKDKPAGKHLQFCLAEYQNKGRGRLGRTWVAPFGANILLTCRFRLDEDLSHFSGLGLCVGLAVLKALGEFGIEELSCKWPNDVLHRGKKLAGILIETRAEANGVAEAMIGVGINMNMPADVLKELERPSTSLQAILGAPQDRNKIAALIINSLCAHLKQFKQGEFELEKEWAKYDFLKDKAITLHLADTTVEGIACGIEASGRLLLKLPSGEMKAYSAGEASLRKQ